MNTKRSVVRDTEVSNKQSIAHSSDSHLKPPTLPPGSLQI